MAAEMQQALTNEVKLFNRWSFDDVSFLFKKYLECEKSLGDEERVERPWPMDYVETTLA